MPIRVIFLVSIQRAGSALTGKWVSAAPAHHWARIHVRETAAHNNFAEAP
jgi:hypothetical protein